MSSSLLGSRVLISGAWTRLVLEAFETVGLDTEALCLQAGVDRELLTDPQARFPRDTAGELWRAAAKASKDRFLGLHAGAQIRRKPKHVFELLFLKCATFGEGVQAGLRFQGLVAHGQVATLEEETTGKRIRLNKVEGDLPVTDHEIEFIAATMMNYFGMATGNQFRLEKITFAHPYRGMIEEYERIFGCAVFFGEPETELWISDDVWNLELSAGDPTAQRELETLAAELHQNIELAGFLSAVAREIGRLLQGGHADVANVASALHLSARTLQRRLREEGTTFRALVDATPRSMVVDGVEHRRTPAEIARRAGFANTRGLTRALRRWGRKDPTEVGGE